MVNLTYIRKRRRRRAAAIVSGICSVVISIFIIIAFCIIYVDRFTIKTTETRLCLTLDKETTTTMLVANPNLKVTDTQYTDIPADIEDGIKDKSTYHYFAYSFYLGTQQTENNLDYKFVMSLDNVTKDLDEAVKIMIIQDGYRKIYSKNPVPIYYGNPETKVIEGVSVTSEQITQFNKGKYIITTSDTISPGEYSKYTVVMWIDGWESTDSMKGGTFTANVEFSTDI